MPACAGWLSVTEDGGESVSRWFELNRILMSEHEDESAPASWTFPLLCCTVKKDVPGLSFTINPLNTKFVCANLEELNKWVTALRGTLKRDINKYYSIGKDIGEGCNAIVKTATNLQTKEEVVVKVTDLSITQASQLVNLMVDVLILFSVEHNNLARPLDYFEGDSKVYLVMERLHGGTLEDNILNMDGRVPEEAVRDAMYRLLGAVNALHDVHIVHCDIKIDNIVCKNSTVPLEPKLIDLGSGMHEDSVRESGGSGNALFYMAPEQVERKGCSRAVDMWGCGIVMYWLVTQKHPFEADYPGEIMRKIVSRDIEFGLEWDEYSPELKQLVERLLEPDAEKRATAPDALKHPWFAGYAAESRERKSTDPTGLFGPAALLLRTLRPSSSGEGAQMQSTDSSSVKSQSSLVTASSGDQLKPSKSSPSMRSFGMQKSGSGSIWERTKSQRSSNNMRGSIDSSTPELPMKSRVFSRMKKVIIGVGDLEPASPNTGKGKRGSQPLGRKLRV